MSEEENKPAVPVTQVGEAIQKLIVLGGTLGCCLYSIHLRDAGFGIEWYERSRQGAKIHWKEGLVTYNYWPTLEECLFHELARIMQLAAGKEAAAGIETVRSVLRK